LFCEAEEELVVAVVVMGWGTGMAMLAAREVPRRLARREDDWESVLAVVVVEVLVRRGPEEGLLG
jgi:dolichol kinase